MTVAVVGAAESDLGVTGLSSLALQTQSVTRALTDAGLRLSDVDGLATTGLARFSTAQLAAELGLRPAWTDSTAAGGASFEMYVPRAVQAIEAGQASTVVNESTMPVPAASVQPRRSVRPQKVQTARGWCWPCPQAAHVCTSSRRLRAAANHSSTGLTGRPPAARWRGWT